MGWLRGLLAGVSRPPPRRGPDLCARQRRPGRGIGDHFGRGRRRGDGRERHCPKHGLGTDRSSCVRCRSRSGVHWSSPIPLPTRPGRWGSRSARRGSRRGGQARRDRKGEGEGARRGRREREVHLEVDEDRAFVEWEGSGLEAEEEEGGRGREGVAEVDRPGGRDPGRRLGGEDRDPAGTRLAGPVGGVHGQGLRARDPEVAVALVLAEPALGVAGDDAEAGLRAQRSGTVQRKRPVSGMAEAMVAGNEAPALVERSRSTVATRSSSSVIHRMSIWVLGWRISPPFGVFR